MGGDEREGWHPLPYDTDLIPMILPGVTAGLVTVAGCLLTCGDQPSEYCRCPAGVCLLAMVRESPSPN